MINGAKLIIEKLNENGHLAYMVGGCVRDIIMNNIPYDYDITTSAKPEEVIEIFQKTIPTGLKHGTVSVIINNNIYEVTTFRIDGTYTDFRRPKDVIFSDSLFEDVKRRDFTINSIAYNDKEGFIDFFNGKSDIENKIIRTVNDPYERFCEDALRILRGIRFCAKFDFKIEEKTFNAMKDLMHLVKNISKERIYDELKKMFAYSPFNSVKLLKETGFFNTLNFEINENIENLKKLNIKNFETVISVLTYKKDSYEYILNTLKCSNKTKSNIRKILESFEFSLDDKLSVKRMLKSLRCENIMDEIFEVRKALGFDDCKVISLYNEIIDNNECYLLTSLKINGNDLLKMNIKKERISIILNYLLDKVIEDNSLNTKDNLIDIVIKEFF